MFSVLFWVLDSRGCKDESLQEKCGHFHRARSVFEPVMYYRDKYCPPGKDRTAPWREKTNGREPGESILWMVAKSMQRTESMVWWYVQGNHHSRVSWVVQDFVHPQYGCGSKLMGSHFGVGEFTHFRTYFSGGWDVHLGF